MEFLEKQSKNLNENEKTIIKESVKKNTHYISQFSKYHPESITVMFVIWHKLFPEQKQDMNCSSCRKAVTKFFNLLVVNWEEEKQNKKTKNKTNGRKKKQS